MGRVATGQYVEGSGQWGGWLVCSRVRARLHLVGDVALVLMAGDEAAVNTLLQVLHGAG